MDCPSNVLKLGLFSIQKRIEKISKTEKKMRTKVYFLMDTSGSMCCDDMKTFSDERMPTRLHVAHGAFNSLKQIVDELKDEDGCDVDSEAYAFADTCEQFFVGKEMPKLGGGTSFALAINHVVAQIEKDDPANKRILVVITDGEVGGDARAVEEKLSTIGQDIRIVMIKIGECRHQSHRMFRHNITSVDTANTATYEAFEEAL